MYWLLKLQMTLETITKSIQINFVAPFYYGDSMSFLTSAIITGMTAVASDNLSINNLSGKTIRWNFTNSKNGNSYSRKQKDCSNLRP